MAEKILQTRIQLKYDTLTNWNASTFKLKAGELAIVSLGEVKDGTTAGNANQHPVLFKVGTGNHTFAELPFASALAADVYAWGKAADVKLEGKILKFVDAAGTAIKEVPFNYITEAEVNTILEDYYTKEEVEGLIKVETDRALAAEEALSKRIDALNAPENGFATKDEFDALKELVEDEDGAMAKAEEALTLAGTKVTAEEGKSLVDDTEIAKLATIAEGAQVNVIETIKVNGEEVTPTAKAVDITVPTKVSDLENDSDFATKAEAEGYANAKDEAIEAAQAAADKAQSDIDTYKETNDARIETILNGTDAEKVDSLNELITWVDEHAGEVEGIKTDIESRVEKTVYEEHLTAQDTRDGGQDEKIAALEAKPGLDKVGTITKVTAGEGLTGGGEDGEVTLALDDATKASLALADTALQSEAIANMATNTVVLEAEMRLEGKITELENGAVKTNTDAIAAINNEETGILAQAKAYSDSLEHEDTKYTAAADGGLKLNAETNEFSIDDSLVFVFDCGSSTKNIAE